MASVCDATETYSPVAIDTDPPATPANPASSRVWVDALPPATPLSSAMLDTRPSMTPNTAGRSQPPVTSRCEWWISGRTSEADVLMLSRLARRSLPPSTAPRGAVRPDSEGGAAPLGAVGGPGGPYGGV